VSLIASRSDEGIFGQRNFAGTLLIALPDSS
jgi:hypothetical protein